MALPPARRSPGSASCRACRSGPRACSRAARRAARPRSARATRRPTDSAFASLGNASSEIWPLNRNSSRNTSGDRRQDVEEGAHRLGPRPQDRRRRRRSRPTGRSARCPRRRSTSSAPARRSARRAPPRSTRCATWRASGPISPISSSIASRIAGGSTTSSTEKLMMSKPEEPRAAKNSGLSFSRSNSGCATAKVQRTARFKIRPGGALRPLLGHYRFGRA